MLTKTHSNSPHKLSIFNCRSLLLVALMMLMVACQSPVESELKRELNFAPYEAALATMDDARQQQLDALLLSATIPDMQALMAAGDLSAVELTTYYLARIQKYDAKLNSVMELNPDAILLAEQLDAERAAGDVRGVLHGIPILLKDNIATGDQMHNTSGAAVLVDHRAPRDSFVAQQLRDAGAVLLGKANLSEWANFMSSSSSSGYSTLGSQVVNPYGKRLIVHGSSTGSAVSASARFAAATVGSETTGSIIAPASANGATGMRPTLGLVSGDLIIPITAALDSAGPMGRNVTDLAVLLTVLSAEDTSDAFVNYAGDIHGTDFAAALGSASLDGLTIGVPFVEGTEQIDDKLAKLTAAITVLEAAGAQIVPVAIDADEAAPLSNNQIPILAGSMAADVAHYFAEAEASISTLDEVVAANKENLDQFAPFGQNYLEMALKDRMSDADHKALSLEIREVGQTIIRQAAEQHDLDIILSFENEFSLYYALAGIPAVTVPMGLNDGGQPVGATFVGVDTQTDAQILAIAYAFEQASMLRIEPNLDE